MVFVFLCLNSLSMITSSPFPLLQNVIILFFLWLSSIPGGAVVKNPPSNGGDAREAGPILGLGRSEVEMTTHSSMLAWKTPWTEKPGRLQSMGLQRVGHGWVTGCACAYTHTHPSFIDEDNEVQRSRIPVPMAELAAFWKWETKGKEASRRQASGVWNTAWEEHWTYHVDTLVTNRLVISRKELIFLNLIILNSEIKAFHENCWFPNVSTHRNHRGLLSSAPLTHPQFLIQ